ncbi:amino acid transporter [Coemansia reversa NRRL 1564]|uniref:Amino acid transporter n=1 Tax=Coemansia reversa (strain ATCC 12441 / NRRL 1564) TaxID=763665 RepID=A0A2G5B498_COERN|nr:amino acid transporter [Coemansia reversa NRRL 1564]|eukprot:PIA13825.1 amino acid transporter [Coemansia reversa NRRL 1564]
MAMVIGTMIGSGIFSTTSLILQAVGSVGMSMGVWILGAAVSVCVCIAYVELGTMLPRSGGEKEYLDAAFRRPRALMPFLFCLSSIVICSPSGLAADAVVTGTYFLYAATGRAVEHSEWTQRIIGVSVVILCAVLHGFFVRFAIRVQSTLTIVKLVLLLLIVVVGVCSWIKGNGAPNAGFHNAFQGTSVHPSAYLSALFKVMFAYSGFNVLNYSIDELKNPVRNLPRAALGGLFVTTVLYVASNAAYFLVLDPETIRRSSTAVAGVFFTNTLGDVWGQRIVPVLIGLATLGNIMCGVFAASRLVFEAAREGYLPGGRVLGEISRFQSPLAALAVTCLMTVLFIVTPPAGEAYAFLIDIGVYPLWLFQGVAVIGLLVMRRTHRDLLRPFKAWQIANVVTLACAAFMLVFAFVKPSKDAASTSGSIPYWAAPLTALTFIALTCGLWYIQIVCRRGLERSFYRGKHAGFE